MNEGTANIVVDIVQHQKGEKAGDYQAILPEATITNGLPQKKAITKVPLPREETQGYLWAPWGKKDGLPTEIRKKIEKVPMAGSTIYKLVSMMYGNGLIYYKNEEILSGNTRPQRAQLPEVEAFLRRNRIALRYLVPQFTDYRYIQNTFSEMILNKRKDKIVGLYHKPAEFCRLAKQNERTLNIDKLFISADFAHGRPPNKERRAEVPLMVWHDQERFIRKLRGYKFMWHSKFETPGITYYARPFWIGLFRKDGWLDVSANVPRIVSAMQNNQVSIKYQILISEEYFKFRHGSDWDAYSNEERNKHIDNKIAEINKALVGVDNVFKSISTIFKEDPVTKNRMGLIDIIAVDDKAKTGVWVPDSTYADTQIALSLGLHPSQLGLQTGGGKNVAGSGSDMREGYNTGISLNTIDQEICLEALNFVSEFNGWGVTFCIDHTHHTTTNNQESGLEPSDNTIIPE